MASRERLEDYAKVAGLGRGGDNGAVDSECGGVGEFAEGGFGGFGAGVNLGVVGVTVEIHGEVAQYLTKGEEVNDEEEGAEYRTLGERLA